MSRTPDHVTAALEFRDCMEIEWLELSRYHDLLRHHIDTHDATSQGSSDRLLTAAEAVVERLNKFMAFLGDEFS